MTTLITSTGTSSSASPGVGRGLALSVLRLHRSALWLWLLLVVVLSATMLWAYGPGFDAADTEGRERCRANSEACYFPSGPALDRYDTAVSYSTLAVACLPFLVAVWAGAALIARELETGTAHLAWTQSVSPTCWLAAKLAVPALLITAGSAVLVPLHRLVWNQDAWLRSVDWFDGSIYPSNGTLPLAYALCGLALGALAGLVVGRALPALGVAFAALLAVLYLANEYRLSLWPTVTVTGAKALNLPDKALRLDQGVITDKGTRIGNNMACTVSDGAADLQRCLTRSGLDDIWATYHPKSHFWPLQLAETGVVLAVAALAVTAAFVLLRRRTATEGVAV
ncbi:ABC transporter permease [Streptomyces phaeochromogenes]|uniref:ABC transporter permease n=1 Tax=Streptomyces phaeochromogenes TaxID=1923 RepID=A0ABZ1HF54_STRPH|nr:ABC transporter permease [Streptomyces phaeochromogenes]WSD16203.1 ABC transporter permease [Streptomyces phaeochromogenes]